MLLITMTNGQHEHHRGTLLLKTKRSHHRRKTDVELLQSEVSVSMMSS